MADEHEKSYVILFNAITDALEAIGECNYGQARGILVRAQRRAEEEYISAGDGEDN